MYIFRRSPNPENDRDHITLTLTIPDEQTLPDMCEFFADFLRGCGFSFEGSVEIVEPETYSEDEVCEALRPRSETQSKTTKKKRS